jgi:hypothetical protein
MTTLPRPRFSPEINFGHLLQAAVLLVTIGGGAITSYLSLRSDIETVRGDVTIRETASELRITNAESMLKELRADNHEFQLDMRSSITRITDMLGDLRVQIAHRGAH